MFKGKTIDFIGNRKRYFMISTIIIGVIILASFIFGVNLDIRFKGGTILAYSYTGEINMDSVKTTVENNVGSSVSIEPKTSIIGGETTFDIVFVTSEGIDSEIQAELDAVLKETYASNELNQLSVTSVKPNIGHEFLLKCIVAVVFGSIIMIIYIALRFRKISGWSAGVMAVIALLHDIAIVFGTFIIFKLSINDSFIAVVLTILGYSINDTIVVYDRIRENEVYYNKTKSIPEIVNMSINQTLARSINTTASTVIAMVVVCVVALLTGVTSIITFALPMIVGLISGTYSTLFIAAPLWVVWQEHKAKKLDKK